MFGPYELQSLLGVGGMGEVYRAYDFGEINGVLYIDMRLVEGNNVHTVLRENGRHRGRV